MVIPYAQPVVMTQRNRWGWPGLTRDDVEPGKVYLFVRSMNCRFPGLVSAVRSELELVPRNELDEALAGAPFERQKDLEHSLRKVLYDLGGLVDLNTLKQLDPELAAYCTALRRWGWQRRPILTEER